MTWRRRLADAISHDELSMTYGRLAAARTERDMAREERDGWRERAERAEERHGVLVTQVARLRDRVRVQTTLLADATDHAGRATRRADRAALLLGAILHRFRPERDRDPLDATASQAQPTEWCAQHDQLSRPDDSPAPGCGKRVASQSEVGRG